MSKVVWSHSKINTLLNNPCDYHILYDLGIQPKIKASALSMGSAFHWGVEHETEVLDDYYKEEGNFKQQNNYTKEQLLVESMVHGYLKHKEEIFEKILKEIDSDKKLQLLEEYHELKIESLSKSKTSNEPNHFLGIIDLLLLTNKGFIVIDYKTSSQIPDFEKYKEQLYRYIFLLNSQFPDVPIYKIGIINVRKTAIRQKKNENDEEFKRRLRFEYDLNDENLVNYFEFSQKEIDENFLKEYSENLNDTMDGAQIMVDNNVRFINFSNLISVYGKSQFFDIYYKTPDAHLLYEIKDYIYDEEENEFKETRDCVPLDMDAVFESNCLNKFSIFKEEFNSHQDISFDDFLKFIKCKYKTDSDLLRRYVITLKKSLDS